MFKESLRPLQFLKCISHYPVQTKNALHMVSYKGISNSVRAMQSMLDMTLNAKIPDNLVHKLSFERFRIKFQCLERLPFNFKIMVFLLWFWWHSSQPF